MTSPRTYAYIQALVKRGQAMRAVERMQQHSEAKATFEKGYAKEIAEAWSIIESAADRGAIRVFVRDHPVLQKPEIQNYFASKGFCWSNHTSTDGCLEWYRETEMK